MRQSEEVKYRTEIATLKATLYQLRFALPLKKAAEELFEEWVKAIAENTLPDNLPLGFRNAMDHIAEALENKRRYEDKSGESVQVRDGGD